MQGAVSVMLDRTARQIALACASHARGTAAPLLDVSEKALHHAGPSDGTSISQLPPDHASLRAACFSRRQQA